EVQTQETPTHDVIESDEHDLSDASPYVNSESDNECRRPTPNDRKYRMILVPFTGIDHNQKSVTFGARLLSDETFHSYTWLLTTFKQAYRKEPLMAVTDQDVALRNAIEFVFPESHHKLCMGHITQKLFGKVVINELDRSITCSCNHFGCHGYLCRHVFCALYINSIDTTPKQYISKRWRKDVCPRHLLEKRHRYGPCVKEIDQLASDIHTTIEYYVNRLRNDTEKLTEFLAKVNELKQNLDGELPPEPQKPNNKDIFQKLLGVTTPNEVVVKVPKGIRNKGCVTGGA
nr:FAR1 DNA binding domain-containing protein [Tanacetum cinerariifolium]